MAQDPDLQPLYCAWAESRWPHLAPIEEVRLDFGARGPYSDVTPDLDLYVKVELKTERVSTWDGWKSMDAGWDLPSIIAEILQFDRKSR